MIFETHQLEAPLAKHIESVFHFKGFMPDHSIERVVPTGHIFLLFELDGLTRNTFDNETLKPNAEFNQVWISGMHKNYISISAHENSEMFVIQFKADGAYPFIHKPIEGFNDTIEAAEQVFGDDVLQFRKQLLDAECSADKFTVAEAWLLNRFDVTKQPPEELSKLLTQLQSQPIVKYQEIIDQYPNTQKHLIDQFKQFIGLTPKVYQRILRFNDILQLIQNKQQISWPDVALQCGYSDQSHFIKEFVCFSGLNPTEFLQQKFNHDEANFFPLDREL